jgi:choline kinase
MALDVSAIVIAAGLGSRLSPYTDDRPKCMLPFAGKPLLGHQIDTLRACGITEISVVRGYMGDKIDLTGVTYFENEDYRDNNILESLMCAEPALSGNVVCLYSDIWFEASVVETLLATLHHDISIVVDTDWRDYYVGRMQHPLDEAENVVFSTMGTVAKIGKIGATSRKVDGEFIGMLKLTPRGTGLFKEHYRRARDQYWGKPFQRAKTFQKAYLTDLFQEMADLGVTIGCTTISRGWKEIDTVEDYQKALKAMGDASVQFTGGWDSAK